MDEGEGRSSSLSPTAFPLPLASDCSDALSPVLRCGVECYAMHCLITHTQTTSTLLSRELSVANGSGPLVVMSCEMTQRVTEEG